MVTDFGIKENDITGFTCPTLAGNQEIYKRRQAIVEYPFGTIKRQWWVPI